MQRWLSTSWDNSFLISFGRKRGLTPSWLGSHRSKQESFESQKAPPFNHTCTYMICILLFWYNKGKVYQYVIFNHTCTLVSLHIFFPKVLWMVYSEEKTLSYSPSCPVYWHQCHGNTQPLCHHCKPLLKKMKTDFLRLIFQQPCALSLKPWLSPGYSASGNSMCAILVETLGWVRNARVRARASIFRSCAAGLLPG